jgi:hypothetical protein
MRKWIIAVIVAGALFAVGAFAASFALNAENVSSGADPVAACGANATVRWHIDDSNAVQGTPSAPTANFLINAYDVSAPGCGNADYRLAIQGTSEVLCPGTLSGGAVTGISLTGCSPGGTTTLNVNDVTGAALLIGDQPPIALQTTP